MSINVVEYSEQWPRQFDMVASTLHRALASVPVRSIEHVGSTAVPGLAAKPVLDIDIIVSTENISAAITALAEVGYTHRGDLGVTGREAFQPPDTDPRRHVYVCEAETLHVRNHLAVRQVLTQRPDLRDKYAAVKRHLSEDPDMDIDRYLAGKSAVLQEVLSLSDLTVEERSEILRLNNGS